MSEHNVDILLRAKDQASKAIKGVNSELGKTGKIGAIAGKGVRTTARNLAGIGAIAAVGIGAAVKTGLDDLATLETAITSVNGAIRVTGQTGKVTGAQVADWANQIESSIHAAFDDKDITAGTASLIRYGHVARANLRPAMVVMTDLAVKTGSVEAASKLLGKALADPVKGMTALRRVGVVLTAEQQKQVTSLFTYTKKEQAALKGMTKAQQKAWMARHQANATIKAQALLLKDIAKVTKGAADASQGPYARSLAVLADVSEDARKALAEGFLPVIEKVSDLLSGELAKPQTLSNIKQFGEGLASGLDDLIEIARKLPWAQIGDSLKLAGAGGRAILSAFSSMPPWVQTAVLTGWGLNKLTGGALGGIVGELSKGLIKGVLGMTAGVVNLKAGVVNGGGVPGGAAGGAAGATGKLGAVASLISKALIVGAIAEIADAAKPVITGAGIDIHQAIVDAFDIKIKLPIPDPNDLQWPFGPKNTPTILPEIFGGNGVLGGTAGQSNGPGLTGHAGPGRGADTSKITTSISTLQHGAVTAVDGTTTAVNTSKAAIVSAQSQAEHSITSGVAASGVMGANAATGGASRVTSQSIGNTSRLVGAITSSRPIVTTNVAVYVTGAAVTKSVQTQARYGPGGGSASNDRKGGK